MRLTTYRLLQPVIILLIIVVIGITGYMIIEHASLLNALFMTTISITTVGYGEVIPLSEAGKWFTIFLLIISWSTFAFAITRITQFIVSGEVHRYFKTRKLMKDIGQLQDHVIVCGYGRNGHEAVKILRSHGLDFVVIEKNHDLMDRSRHEDGALLRIEGDSTNDDVLLSAGIERARALISTLPVDADNLFIVLSARGLNPELQIISRCSDVNSIAKLKKAGANNVIMPDRIGGSYMANLVSKPDVVEFIDFLSGEEGGGINIDSVAYDALPPAIRGKSLHEVMQWNKTGVNCLGVKSPSGKFILNPPTDIIIEPGMKIIILGTHHQVRTMKANLK